MRKPSNIKTSWTELDPGYDHPGSEFVEVTVTADGTALVDIGFGAVAAEVVVVPDLPVNPSLPFTATTTRGCRSLCSGGWRGASLTTPGGADSGTTRGAAPPKREVHMGLGSEDYERAQIRIEDLESALRRLLDTGHGDHRCGDANCPIDNARNVLDDKGWRTLPVQ